MKLEQLQKKAAAVGKKIGRTLSIGSMRRLYRVEDQTKGENPLFGLVYLSAQTLWDRLEYAERVLDAIDTRPVQQVEITIINRKGMGSHTETVFFENMANLKEKVDALVEAVPFHKVIVELTPNWAVTKEEQAALNAIEGE